MLLKGAGLRVLRWILWTLLAWVLLRGVVSFLPKQQAASTGTEPAAAAAKPAEQPAGLQAFPAMFAREYLTWRPGDTAERATRLQPFLGSGLDGQAGWQPGKDGSGQTVEGVWVYGVKQVTDARWLVTVAAGVSPFQESVQADPGGTTRQVRTELPRSTVYLAVPVTALKQGGWVVSDYPALVARPAQSDPAESSAPGPEVTDRDDRVKGMATGFFRAYLGAGGDLSYFVAPGVTLPAAKSAWSFDSVAKVSLYNLGTSHAAAVDVLLIDPATGARFTSRYSLGLTERENRWYVTDLLQKGE